MKKIFFFLTILNLSFIAFATSLTFQEETYSGNIIYNEEAEPGQAVFARMNIKFSRNLKKKNIPEVKAVMQLFSSDKKLENSVFYVIPQKGKKQANVELLAGLPLSTWLDAKKTYQLKIIFSVQDSDEKEFYVPLNLHEAKINSETIDLNAENTNIKQNMTSERLAQIEKLNKILGTVNPSSVYSLKAFEKPVQSERMTSYCWDRRTYRYVNGKTETTLHYGNDYGIPTGTEVRACQEGKVVLAEFRISTGWSVVIEHLPGLYSLYYHMNSLNVKAGDYVKCSDLIGLSGATGLATGPHLHWEVRLNMCAVQPEFFMNNYTFEAEEN